jgi:3-oxoacyl-[acyl-carrier-protein] synthase-1
MVATVPNAYIYGIGMVTAVGDSTQMTAASVRAGLSRFEESSIYNKDFNPMTMALLPEDILPPLNEQFASMPKLTSRHIRMLRLADPAIKEALENLPISESVPLFLAGPEDLPECPAYISDEFIDHLIVQTSANIDRAQSKYFPLGRAGGLIALQAAMILLSQGQHDYILVGGVDTYLDLYLLGTLDFQDRVAAERITDGFIPGEGAGFLLITSKNAMQNTGAEPVISISQPGVASESGHRYSDQPYRGDGLAKAFTIAIEKNNALIKTIMVSLNGESFGAKEYGVATLRNSPDLDPDFQTEHPADCFGDIGAAFAPALIGLAAIGLQKGYINGPVLSYCSSEGEHRGAVCVNVDYN